MPLLRIQTSAPAPSDPDALLRSLSAELARRLGKPEAYVMTLLDTTVPMTFGGSAEPACFVELKSIGQFSAAQTKDLSTWLCGQLATGLGVPPERTYIEFSNAQGSLWGWNGDTFG